MISTGSYLLKYICRSANLKNDHEQWMGCYTPLTIVVTKKLIFIFSIHVILILIKMFPTDYTITLNF